VKTPTYVPITLEKLLGDEVEDHADGGEKGYEASEAGVRGGNSGAKNLQHLPVGKNAREVRRGSGGLLRGGIENRSDWRWVEDREGAVEGPRGSRGTNFGGSRRRADGEVQGLKKTNIWKNRHGGLGLKVSAYKRIINQSMSHQGRAFEGFSKIIFIKILIEKVRHRRGCWKILNLLLPKADFCR